MIDIYISNQSIAIKKKQVNISPYRQKKLLTYKNESDRLLCLTATYLLNEGLKKYSLKEEDMNYGVNPHGKPFFAEYEEICFNLSHSGDYAACAFCNNPVGIDIQCKKEINPEIARRFFTKNEYKYISDSSNSHEVFVRLWTLKESYLKLIGTGLSKGLNSFEVGFAGNEPYICGKSNYFFYEIDRKDFHLAVCCEKNPGVVSVNFLK